MSKSTDGTTAQTVHPYKLDKSGFCSGVQLPLTRQKVLRAERVWDGLGSEGYAKAQG